METNIDKQVSEFESRKPHEEFLPEPQTDHTPAAMIQMAIAQGADLDKLEKLMTLQERYEENEAKKLFNKAVSDFKAHLPTILKDKDNKQYNSKYVSEANLMNTVNPELSKYGLNAHFQLEQNGNIKVTCILTHSAGYSESTSMSAPADSSGSKNAIQQIKSTVTYLRKMTFEAITGVATTDPEGDDDGNAAGTEMVNDKELSQIVDMVNETGTDLTKFLEAIPKAKFKTAMVGLEAKLKKQQEKAA